MRGNRKGQRGPKVPTDLPVIRALDEVVDERRRQSGDRAAAKSARRPTTEERDKMPTFGPASPHVRTPRTYIPLAGQDRPSRAERGNYTEPPQPSEDNNDRLERETQTVEGRATELVYVELDELESEVDQKADEEVTRDEYLKKQLRTALAAIQRASRAMATDEIDEDAVGDRAEDLGGQPSEAESGNSEIIATLRNDLDQANQALRRAQAKRDALEQTLQEKHQEIENLSRALELKETSNEEVVAAGLDEAETGQEEESEELELADEDEEEEEDLPLAGSARRLARKSKKKQQVTTGPVRRAASAAPKQPRAKKARKKSKTR